MTCHLQMRTSSWIIQRITFYTRFTLVVTIQTVRFSVFTVPLSYLLLIFSTGELMLQFAKSTDSMKGAQVAFYFYAFYRSLEHMQSLEIV